MDWQGIQKCKKEGGGYSCHIGEKKVLIAKVKNSVMIQPRQGKWILIVHNLNRKNNNEFLYPVLLNTIIKHNLVVSKFSPQSGVLRIPKPFNIQLKYLSCRKPSSFINIKNFRAS